MFETPRYYSGLDLVRFAAAAVVMLFHLGSRAWIDGSAMDWTGAEAAGDPTWLLAGGFVGVQVFFVLSGLVIANSVSGETGLLKFARSRILRLIPAAVICATGSAVIAVIFKDASVPGAALAWLASATLWPLGGWIEPIYWTLAVEIAFYSLIGVWLLIGRPIPLLWVALILQAGSTAFLFLWAIDAEPFGRDASRLLLLRHGCMFAAGMLIALKARGERSRIIAPALAAAVAASVLQIILYAGQGEALAALLFLVAIGAIYWALHWEAPADRFRLLGLSTYPLYLIHMSVGGAIIHLSVVAGLTYWPTVILACVGSVLIALAISRFLEPPLRIKMGNALDRVIARAGVARSSSAQWF